MRSHRKNTEICGTRGEAEKRADRLRPGCQGEVIVRKSSSLGYSSCPRAGLTHLSEAVRQVIEGNDEVARRKSANRLVRGLFLKHSVLSEERLRKDLTELRRKSRTAYVNIEVYRRGILCTVSKSFEG